MARRHTLVSGALAGIAVVGALLVGRASEASPPAKAANVYPAYAEKAFLGDNPSAAQRCLLATIESRYTFDQFVVIMQDYAATKQHTPEIQRIIASCVQ